MIRNHMLDHVVCTRRNGWDVAAAFDAECIEPQWLLIARRGGVRICHPMTDGVVAPRGEPFSQEEAEAFTDTLPV